MAAPHSSGPRLCLPQPGLKPEGGHPLVVRADHSDHHCRDWLLADIDWRHILNLVSHVLVVSGIVTLVDNSILLVREDTDSQLILLQPPEEPLPLLHPEPLDGVSQQLAMSVEVEDSQGVIGPPDGPL